MASGRNLTVYLTSDVSRFGRGLKQAEDRLTRFRRNASRALSGIGIGVAAGVGAAVVAIGDAVQKASDLNEAISKSNVIFGKQAKGIQTWADGADRAMGLSQRAALDVASTFGALGKQAGMSGKEAADFAKQMAQMAGDLASFNNTSVEDAAAALASGLRGESEPLKRYNINLSDAAVTAQALQMGLVKAEKNTTKVKAAQLTALRAQDAYNEAVKKHGRDSTEAARASMAWEVAQGRLAEVMKGSVPKLTDAQKTVARTAVIMNDGKDALGDYARTADGIANTQRTVVSQIEDIQADFGRGFLDGLGGIEDAGNDAKDSLQEMEDKAEVLGRNLGTYGANLLQFAVDFLASLDAINVGWNNWIDDGGRKLTDIQDFLGIISDEEGQAINNYYDKQYLKRVQDFNNRWTPTPDTNYGTGSRLDTYSASSLYRYNTRKNDVSSRGDGRAAQKAARTRSQP